jgi:hypothetical protein
MESEPHQSCKSCKNWIFLVTQTQKNLITLCCLYKIHEEEEVIVVAIITFFAIQERHETT